MSAARQGVHVHLETDGQRGLRIDRRDGLVHAQHVRPQLFVAEGVEAKDRLSFSMFLSAIFLSVAIAARIASALLGGCRLTEPGDAERQYECE